MKFNSSMFMLTSAAVPGTMAAASLFMMMMPGSSYGYVTPGGGTFGRFGGMYDPNNMMTMTPEQRNEMRRQQTEFVNRAFEALVDEVNNQQRTTARNNRRRRDSTSSKKQDDNYDNNEEDVTGKASGGAASNTVDFLEDMVNGIGDYYNDGYYDDNDNTEQFLNLAKKGLGIAKDVMGGKYSPAYDMNEDESMLEISIDLPGVSNSDIDIEVKEEEKILIVSGKRDTNKGRTFGGDNDDGAETKNKPMTFSKTFPLDESIDTTKITASLENGVLVISASKKKKEGKPSTGKRIPVL